MENSNEPKPENKSLDFLNSIRNYFQENYESVKDPILAEFHFTTMEVYDKIQRLFPDKSIFTPADVALWLHTAGFTFYDFGQIRLEWLLKSK